MTQVTDKIIREINDKYFVLFPSSGNWSLHNSHEEAATAADYNAIPEQEQCKRYPAMFTLHITNQCNLNCLYCFADSSRTQNRKMTMKMVKQIAGIIQQSNVSNICIDFHGGEPLIMLNFIKETVEFLNTGFAGLKTINYVIQTNGILLNQEAITYLTGHHFSVGISFDGPKPVHDRNRIFADRTGSFDIILKNIRLAQSLKLDFSVISVITNPDEMETIYDFFKSERIYQVKFIPVMPQGRAVNLEIDRNFLLSFARNEFKVFLKMIKDRENGIPMFLSSSYLLLRKMVYLDNKYMCARIPCGAGIDLLSFDENGNILPCDAMSGSKNLENLIIGNITDGIKLSDICGSTVVRKFAEMKIDNRVNCRSCPYRMICCGGCVSDIFNYSGQVSDNSPLCEYYKNIITLYFNFLCENPLKVIEFLKKI